MRMLISNLNRLTTVTHLTRLFFPFGLLSSARLVGNGDDGRCNGTAMIEMEQEAGMIAMYELHNLQFMNHYIQIEEA
ncbi:RNA recognition motif domain-containing protein [Paraflavitalea pollutisoli]|uniref:RNA recognition motif domain-containing protein n=1 Tax=Paraflavitalea pollutisoli TaxID=3034143 RepID=UPI0023EDE7A8|nr:RNA-binding protein [Paraflavitalea sp. H1-2-19X]